MSRDELAARLAAILDAGGGAAAGDTRLVPLATLESGARAGLDREARWLLAPDDGRPPVRYEPSAAHLFHEVLEQRRTRFDEAIESAASALDLPAADIVFSFPAVEIVRAVLAKEHPYLTRLALEWLRPTELRELRREILAVTRGANVPLAVKELAERLVVPE
jgi:hypothetical protein